MIVIRDKHDAKGHPVSVSLSESALVVIARNGRRMFFSPDMARDIADALVRMADKSERR